VRPIVVDAPSRSTAARRYQKNIIGFARDVLGVPELTMRWAMHEAFEGHEWDGTEEPFVAVARALESWQNCGVESATTTGKTFFGALAVYWFLACWENALVVTVRAEEGAAHAAHLEGDGRRDVGAVPRALPDRGEGHAPHPDPPGRRPVGGGRVRGRRARGGGEGLRDQGAGVPRAAHADRVRGDAGHPPAILTAFRNTCRAPHNLRLAFGNPDHQLDPLHQFCLGPRTVHVRISALDHPNVVADHADLIPGAVSRQGIEDAQAEDGEGRRCTRAACAASRRRRRPTP
jgi:hypothetical protein